MLHIGADKSTLFLGSGIIGRIHGPGSLRMVVIVTPFCEVVGELEAWEVSTRILKINDNDLFVLILWVQ